MTISIQTSPPPVAGYRLDNIISISRFRTKWNIYNNYPVQMKATPHTFRHSFCCWLCENVAGENSMDDIKYIQPIMGHKDASTTLNIYSELRKNNAKDKHAALKEKAQRNVLQKYRALFLCGEMPHFYPVFYLGNIKNTPIFTPVRITSDNTRQSEECRKQAVFST